MAYKLVLLSDTHGYIGEVLDYLKENKPNLLIHCGDYSSDAREISTLLGLRYYCVRGNNDYEPQIPFKRILDIEGYKIYLTHGHKEGIYGGKEILYQKAREASCNLVFFGHTHVYCDIDLGGLRFLNPGSASLPRDGQKSLMSLTFEDGLKVEKINL